MNRWKYFIELLQSERKSIISIYFYAVLYGLIQLSLPLGIQAIINFMMVQTFSTSLWVLIGFVVLGVLLSGILQVNQLKIIEKIQQVLFVKYGYAYANHLPSVDLRYLQNTYAPEKVDYFFDVITLQKGLSKLLIDIPTATIQVLFGLLILCAYSTVFVGFSILLVLMVFIILKVTAKSGMASSVEESNYKYKVAFWLQEVSRLLQTFKVYKKNKHHLNKTDEYLLGYVNARTKHFKILLIQFWSLIIFKVIITAVMLIIGAVLLVNATINVGQFVATEIIILVVLNSVEKLITNFEKIYDVTTALEKLKKVTDMPLQENESSNAFPIANNYAIKVDNIGYKPSEHEILKNVSFEIPQGSVLSITGDSGSGKSTLLKILCGVIAPTSGQVLLNNIAINNYNLEALHSQVGVRFYKTEIFSGTIFDNITLGNESITALDVLNLATRLGIENFISKFEQGLNQKLMSTGKMLSTLEKNKILLLRALIHNPKILFLENPLDGFDDEMKTKIMNYMLSLNHKPTIIITSNAKNKTVLQLSNFILTLKEGQVNSFVKN